MVLKLKCLIEHKKFPYQLEKIIKKLYSKLKFQFLFAWVGKETNRTFLLRFKILIYVNKKAYSDGMTLSTVVQ